MVLQNSYMNSKTIPSPAHPMKEWLKEPLVYHSLFWVIYFSLNVIRWGSYFDDYTYSFWSNLVEFPIHIVLVYFNIQYLMPTFIPKKLKTYVLLLLISVLIISLIRIVLTYNLVTTDIWREASQGDSLFGINYIAAVMIGEIYVVGLTSAIKLGIDRVRFKSRANELEKINLETELALLKSQIQPHFFFNTLNNLYSLTLDKSDKAPETVLKLAELMRYVVYESKNKKVPLTREVKHIQNYLDLEKLRYADDLKVNFNITGKLENHTIAPILLLPFVENIFKHGVSNRLDKKPIFIDVIVENNRLTLLTKNHINTDRDENIPNNDINHHGVGMQNTKRRLNLLFENRYTLDINTTSDLYTNMLKIPLT